MSLLLVVSLFCISTDAQTSFSDDDLHKQDVYTYSQIKEYHSFLDSVVKSNAESIDKKIRDDYKDVINEKNKELLAQLEAKKFIFDKNVYPYLTNLFFSIVRANNLEKYPFRLFISRSSAVNAYSFEDCTIVCNLGLLNVMENESQLVMVFCHELGHYLLKHSYKSILSHLENYNSDEFLTKVKSLKKEKYNKKSKLETLLMEDAFNQRKHDRTQETSADSLGMILFLKTGYNTNSVPSLYDRLENSDEIMAVTSIRSFLEKEKLKANEQWFDLGKKISFGEVMAKEIADSLKTHPDCSKRKQYAINFLHSYSSNGHDFSPGGQDVLSQVKKTALLEECRYTKERKNMSYYLYQLIQADAQFAKDKFIINEIFNTLTLFTLAQKNHSLFSITDKPYFTTDTKDQYAPLLKMLEQIELSQLAGITISYYQNNENIIKLTKEMSVDLTSIKQL